MDYQEFPLTVLESPLRPFVISCRSDISCIGIQKIEVRIASVFKKIAEISLSQQALFQGIWKRNYPEADIKNVFSSLTGKITAHQVEIGGQRTELDLLWQQAA